MPADCPVRRADTARQSVPSVRPDHGVIRQRKGQRQTDSQGIGQEPVDYPARSRESGIPAPSLGSLPALLPQVYIRARRLRMPHERDAVPGTAASFSSPNSVGSWIGGHSALFIDEHRLAGREATSPPRHLLVGDHTGNLCRRGPTKWSVPSVSPRRVCPRADVLVTTPVDLTNTKPTFAPWLIVAK